MIILTTKRWKKCAPACFSSLALGTSPQASCGHLNLKAILNVRKYKQILQGAQECLLNSLTADLGIWENKGPFLKTSYLAIWETYRWAGENADMIRRVKAFRKLRRFWGEQLHAITKPPGVASCHSEHCEEPHIFNGLRSFTSFRMTSTRFCNGLQAYGFCGQANAGLTWRGPIFNYWKF